jgi:hypothetical protein
MTSTRQGTGYQENNKRRNQTLKLMDKSEAKSKEGQKE